MSLQMSWPSPWATTPSNHGNYADYVLALLSSSLLFFSHTPLQLASSSFCMYWTRSQSKWAYCHAERTGSTRNSHKRTKIYHSSKLAWTLPSTPPRANSSRVLVILYPGQPVLMSCFWTWTPRVESTRRIWSDAPREDHEGVLAR